MRKLKQLTFCMEKMMQLLTDVLLKGTQDEEEKVQILSASGNSFVMADLGLPRARWRKRCRFHLLSKTVFSWQICDCLFQDYELQPEKM